MRTLNRTDDQAPLTSSLTNRARGPSLGVRCRSPGRALPPPRSRRRRSRAVCRQVHLEGVPESGRLVVGLGHAERGTGNDRPGGDVSGATSQKHRTSGGFRPSGHNVAKIVDGDQFQSASGHCGGHIVDGMRSLTVNLDLSTG